MLIFYFYLIFFAKLKKKCIFARCFVGDVRAGYVPMDVRNTITI